MMEADWEIKRTMTPAEFKRALDILNLKTVQVARFLDYSERQAFNWRSGDAEIPAAVALLLNCLIHYGAEPVVARRTPKP